MFSGKFSPQLTFFAWKINNYWDIQIFNLAFSGYSSGPFNRARYLGHSLYRLAATILNAALAPNIKIWQISYLLKPAKYSLCKILEVPLNFNRKSTKNPTGTSSHNHEILFDHVMEFSFLINATLISWSDSLQLYVCTQKVNPQFAATPCSNSLNIYLERWYLMIITLKMLSFIIKCFTLNFILQQA